MLCNTCYAISIYMKNIELSQNLTKKKTKTAYVIFVFFSKEYSLN